MDLYKFINNKGKEVVICAKDVQTAIQYLEGFDWVKIEKLYTNITIAR